MRTAWWLTAAVAVSLLAAPAAPAAVLDVPERIQVLNQWCWAGSSEAILNYYGVWATQSEIGEYGTEGQNIWNWLYGSSSGPTRRGINMILDNWGVENVYGYYTLTPSAVEDRIDSGEPFVIRWGWDAGGGHFVVGRGYEGSDIYYMDPWPGNGYEVADYDWMVRGSTHTWTHTLECTELPPGTPTPIGYRTPTPSPSPTSTPPGYRTPSPTATPPPSPTPGPRAVPFTEGFEGIWSGGAPWEWTREFISGTTDWTASSGGLYGFPEAAHGGNLNALFFFDGYEYPVTRLISPPLVFGSRTRNARLLFWHAMPAWEPDQDELRVYYRTAKGGDWTLLTSYDSDTPEWTLRTLALPDPGDDYYVCFEGQANYGLGVCVDDVLVTGDASPTPPATPTPLPTASPPPSPTPSVEPSASPSPAATAAPSPTPSAEPSASPSARPSPTASALPTPARLVIAADDYDGDGRTDSALWRAADGSFRIRDLSIVHYGRSGDIPVNGDYNGDGTADYGVWRPGSGRWWVRSLYAGPAADHYYGRSGDVPVPADYDGDFRTDTAVFRPATGRWYVKGMTSFAYGAPGDIPVPGDYDGDDLADGALFRQGDSECAWFVRNLTRVFYGRRGDIPVPGDYDGDGASELALFRPVEGRWYVRGAGSVLFGRSGDVPLPFDYEGDGTAERGLYRPSEGRWYIYGVTSFSYGAAADQPACGKP